MADTKLSDLTLAQYSEARSELYTNQNLSSKKLPLAFLNFGYRMASVEATAASGVTAFGCAGHGTYTAGTSVDTAGVINSSTLSLTQNHYRITAAAGTNSRAQIYPTASNALFRYNASGKIGGFELWTRFFLPSCSDSDTIFFMGVTSSITGSLSGGLTLTDSAFDNCFGIGKATGDTNLQFYSRAGAGTNKTTSLGITLASLETKLLDVYISCIRNSDMTFVLRDLDSNTIYSNTETDNAYLPVQDVTLRENIYISTGSTGTTAKSIGFCSHRQVPFEGDVG